MGVFLGEQAEAGGDDAKGTTLWGEDKFTIFAGN